MMAARQHMGQNFLVIFPVPRLLPIGLLHLAAHAPMSTRLEIMSAGTCSVYKCTYTAAAPPTGDDSQRYLPRNGQEAN